jgi:hypothetical protein
MLSARSIYGEIFDNDEAFQLFCSIAASGEAQGGWENGRIAAGQFLSALPRSWGISSRNHVGTRRAWLTLRTPRPRFRRYDPILLSLF